MIKYNGYVIGKNGFWLKATVPPVDPYNPYNLDPGVIRLAFYERPEEYNPNSNLSPQADGTCTYVGIQEIDGTVMYVWDYTTGADHNGLDERMKKLQKSFWLVSMNAVGYPYIISFTFRNSHLQRIINPIDLYNIEHSRQISREMFDGCLELRDVAPGIRVYDATALFRGCRNLLEIPVFDWSYQPTRLATAFSGCTSVHSGMKRLYDNWSSVQYHNNCFENCGDNSAVANAERAQIPSDWK